MNNGGDETSDRHFEMAQYDRYPKELRRVYQDAPIQLGWQTAWDIRQKYGSEGVAMFEERIFEYMHGRDNMSTAPEWTYTVKRDGILKKGLHDGREHPQASRDYPWRSYQLTRRDNTTKVTNAYGGQKPVAGITVR